METNQWQDLHLRFRTQLGGENTSVCITFRVSNQGPHGLELFYDCPWAGSDIEAQLVHLDYMTASRSGTFSFITPLADRSHKVTWNVQNTLSYLEQSDSTLQLHIEKLAPQFAVDTYILYECPCKDHAGTGVCTPVKTILTTVDVEELMVTLDIGSKCGCFYYQVYIRHNGCDSGLCVVSTTPSIARNIGSRTALLKMVAYFIGFLSLTCFIAYCLHFKYRKKVEKLMMQTVALLLIHNPVNEAHLRVVCQLAKFLHKKYGVHILLDVLDIPTTLHKDPISWFSWAVKTAGGIAVISTPSCRIVQEAIYRDLYAVALRQIKEAITSNSTIPIFNIILPYCDVYNLPPETINLRSFHLSQHLHDIEYYIHGIQPSIFTRSVKQYKATTDLKHCTDDLNAAVQDMEQVLNLDVGGNTATQEQNTWDIHSIPQFKKYHDADNEPNACTSHSDHSKDNDGNQLFVQESGHDDEATNLCGIQSWNNEEYNQVVVQELDLLGEGNHFKQSQPMQAKYQDTEFSVHNLRL